MQMSDQKCEYLLLLNSAVVGLGRVRLQLVMSEELQSMAMAMLQVTIFLTDMMDQLRPVIQQLEGFLATVVDLNLMAEPKFWHVSPLCSWLHTFIFVLILLIFLTGKYACFHYFR